MECKLEGPMKTPSDTCHPPQPCADCHRLPTACLSFTLPTRCTPCFYKKKTTKPLSGVERERAVADFLL